MRFVKVEWDSLSVNERGDYILKKKLKALKGRLKWWNKDVFGWTGLKVEEAVTNLNRLDKECRVLGGGSNEDVVVRRVETDKEVWRNISLKESFLRQKSRVSWLKYGDFNTRFFHNAMRGRQRKNHISFVKTSNGLSEDVYVIKEVVSNFFGSQLLKKLSC